MRVDVAACYRLVALFGMNDLVYNHISGRVPGEEGHFLINPYGYRLRRGHRLEPRQRSTSTASWCSIPAPATASTWPAS